MKQYQRIAHRVHETMYPRTHTPEEINLALKAFVKRDRTKHSANPQVERVQQLVTKSFKLRHR